jgi:hypothetical protein
VIADRLQLQSHGSADGPARWSDDVCVQDDVVLNLPTNLVPVPPRLQAMIESEIPSPTSMPADNLDFAWDRPESAASLQAKLAGDPSDGWLRTAAWLMREARVDQVWQFLTPRQIADRFAQLSPMLGRRRPLWEYLLHAAHELGRI